MLTIKSNRNLASAVLFLYMLLFISCGQEEKRPDVSAIPLSLKSVRFEEDMMNSTSAVELAVYRVEKMEGAYIPCDAVKGWLQSEWTEPQTNADLLSHMIYEGKILYTLKKLMPATEDTLLTGYSKTQLEWCRKNEKNAWS